jgi:hypothetical protein
LRDGYVGRMGLSRLSEPFLYCETSKRLSDKDTADALGILVLAAKSRLLWVRLQL